MGFDTIAKQCSKKGDFLTNEGQGYSRITRFRRGERVIPLHVYIQGFADTNPPCEVALEHSDLCGWLYLSSADGDNAGWFKTEVEYK